MDSSPLPNITIEETQGTRFLVCRIPLPTRGEQLPSSMDLEINFDKQLHIIGQHCLAESLPLYDTQGDPFTLGGHHYSSKGQQNETYQSLFGPIDILRHVYQTSDGGRTLVPLEHNARILVNATPHFGKIVAAKYAQSNARAVQTDLTDHHQRPISDTQIRSIAQHVGKLALSKEAHWTYLPETPAQLVETIALGYDGTCANFCYEGWKNVMVASFSLYDAEGKRLESFYLANAPEEGKKTFFARADREIAQLKKHYPEALWVGVSDGAADLRPELEKHCQQLILDYFHLMEYLGKAAPSFATRQQTDAQWLAAIEDQLKTQPGAAAAILTQLEKRLTKPNLSSEAAQQLQRTICYMSNNLDRMDYAEALAEHLPIGSGVTEAACKSIVKERFCGSGMRWTYPAFQNLLAIRALSKSHGRWGQFWNRFMSLGV